MVDARSVSGPGRITDVPPEEIRASGLRLAKSNGAMSQEELIRAIARDLGFQRTGHIIMRHVGKIISQMIRQGELRRDGSRLLPGA
jgi:hypothetical protein